MKEGHFHVLILRGEVQLSVGGSRSMCGAVQVLAFSVKHQNNRQNSAITLVLSCLNEMAHYICFFLQMIAASIVFLPTQRPVVCKLQLRAMRKVIDHE